MLTEYVFCALQGINEMKTTTNEQMIKVVNNLATYMDFIALETNSPAWPAILVQFDLFFRRLPGILPNPCDMTSVLKIMIAVLKVPGLTSVKVNYFKKSIKVNFFLKDVSK